MSASRGLALGLVALSSLAAGCSSSKKIDLGGECSLNTDCNSPLSCTFGKCHTTCVETRDCPLGQSCVKTPQGGVCQLPVEAECRSALCADGFVCAVDYRCRTVCQVAADCIGAQVCASGVCADGTELDANGDLPQKNPSSLDGSAPDLGAGGVADTGIPGTGGKGGATGMDGSSLGGSGGAGGSSGVSDAAGATPGSDSGTAGSDTSSGAASLDGASEVLTGCGAPAQTTRYFCDDFESGLAGWMVSGQDWNTVSSTWRSPTHSVVDAPSGKYPAGANEVMVMSKYVDLSTAKTPMLMFWHKLALSSSNIAYGTCASGACYCNSNLYCLDTANVVVNQISKDGGLKSSTISQLIHQNNSSTWTLARLSLAAFVGQKVSIQFALVSGPSSPGAGGWIIDDVTIQELD